MKNYKLKVIATRFVDGNAYPRALLRNEVIVVNEDTKNKLFQSDPEGFENLGLVIPKPTSAVNEEA